MRRTIRLFGEYELRSVLEANTAKAVSQVNNEKPNYVLNVSTDDYASFLVAEYSVEPLQIDFDAAYVDAYETQVPAERYPHNFYVSPGKSYPRQGIRFHIPYSGDLTLLSCVPSTRLMWTKEVDVTDAEFSWEVINFSDDADGIRRGFDAEVDRIRTQYKHVSDELAKYPSALEASITRAISERRERLLKNAGVAAAIGLPFRKRDDLPKTFSVASPKPRPSTIARPKAPDEPFEPEPTITDDAYTEILQTIFDLGKTIERAPSTYRGKSEEDLRDLLLMQLQTRFVGSATGETFNKSGKTDILIRHENTNVFIAECKFWAGRKKYLETIDQLLSYLSWRDSKSAVILFVGIKDFSHAISEVKESTPLHAAYTACTAVPNDSWIQYDLHLPDDRNRAVRMATILFHLPQ